MIPIRTEAPVRYAPLANYALIGANLLTFFFINLLQGRSGANALFVWCEMHLPLDSMSPQFHQFLTYQFMHANVGHLIGNMLFLWVFGNSVNSKMGDFTYVLFYLSAGIFSGWCYAFLDRANAGSTLIGASGAIAGVTTAYLVLYPLSRVLVLYWFFLIGFWHVPAIVLILVKIIIWDNILAPHFGGGDQIAYSAHLSGYVFGFFFGMALLLVRGVVRDHFDLLALWHRAYRRRALQGEGRPGYVQSASSNSPSKPLKIARPATRPASASFPPAVIADPMTKADSLREEVDRAIIAGLKDKAIATYFEFRRLRPDVVLAERSQVLIARALYERKEYESAAQAFGLYLDSYPRGADRAEIVLFVGIILARDLGQPEEAEKKLSEAMNLLPPGPRKEQCEAWLSSVRAALGQPESN